MKIKLIILSFLYALAVSAQDEIVELKAEKGNLEGSLLIPEKKGAVPLVLIISDSGPTDRNGNTVEMPNNSLRRLAETFRKNGIASFRFDKRGIGQSAGLRLDEIDMRPEIYLQDIKDWITLLSEDKRFSRLIIAGHGEGSLLGMLAAVNNPKINGFISIAGTGRPIDEVLKAEYSDIPESSKKIIYGMIDSLKKGDTIGTVPSILYSTFRPNIQPYLIALMKYNPQTEIKKLNVPILITTGSTDMQVKELDAQLLFKSQPKAQFKLIKNMNHVLKECNTMDKDFQKTIYCDPEASLNAEFSKTVIDFITRNFLIKKPVVTPPNKK